MEPSTVMLIAGGAAALILGPLTARSTERRDRPYGGPIARAFNLIACMAFVALPVTVLSGLIAQIVTGRHGPLLQSALGLLATTLVSLVIWAAIELPARTKLAPKVQRTALNSWTQEDARNSGL